MLPHCSCLLMHCEHCALPACFLSKQVYSEFLTAQVLKLGLKDGLGVASSISHSSFGLVSPVTINCYSAALLSHTSNIRKASQRGFALSQAYK